MWLPNWLFRIYSKTTELNCFQQIIYTIFGTRKTPTLKIPTRMIPPGQFPPGKPHLRKFSPRTTSTRKIPTRIIVIQKIQLGKFRLIMFTIRPFLHVISFWGQGKSNLKHTNVKRSRLLYASSILYEQFSKTVILKYLKILSVRRNASKKCSM